MAKLFIKKPFLSLMKVKIDGQKVNCVNNDGILETEIEEGKHIIQLYNGTLNFAIREIEVHSEDIKFKVVGNKKSFTIIFGIEILMLIMLKLSGKTSLSLTLLLLYAFKKLELYRIKEM